MNDDIFKPNFPQITIKTGQMNVEAFDRYFSNSSVWQ